MTLQEMQTDLLTRLYEKTIEAEKTADTAHKATEVLHNTTIAFSMCMRGIAAAIDWEKIKEDYISNLPTIRKKEDGITDEKSN